MVLIQTIGSLSTSSFALLLTYAMHSTILFVGAWLLARSLASPRLRELVWKGALVGALMTTTSQAFFAPNALSINFEQVSSTLWTESSQDKSVREEPLANTPGIIGISGGGEAPATVAPTAFNDGNAVAPVKQPSPAATSERTSAPSWHLSLLGLWLVLASIGLLRLASSRRTLFRSLAHSQEIETGALFQLLREQQGNSDSTVALFASDCVSSPVAIGRNSIYVPHYVAEDFDEASLKALLAHELEHLRRRDPAWLLFASVVKCMFPFQPLLRFAIRELRHEAELLCDEGALRQTKDGIALARCLANVAERYAPPALPDFTAAMASTPSQLLQRVERALGECPQAPSKARISLLASLGASTLIALACAGPGVTSSQEEAALEPRVSVTEFERPAGDVSIIVRLVSQGDMLAPTHDGSTPRVAWSGSGPYVREGHEVSFHFGDRVFLDNSGANAELHQYLALLAKDDQTRRIGMFAEQGVVHTDLIPTLEECVEVGFTDISFDGQYGPDGETLSLDGFDLGVTNDRNNARVDSIILGVMGSGNLIWAMGSTGEPNMPQASSNSPAVAEWSFAEATLPLPEPSITVTISSGGIVHLTKGSLAEKPVKLELEPLMDEAGTTVESSLNLFESLTIGLKATQAQSGNKSQLLDAPIRIVAKHDTPFASVQWAMALCGSQDIQAWNLQLEVESEDGAKSLFAIPLPRDIGIGVTEFASGQRVEGEVVEEVEESETGGVFSWAVESPPALKLFFHDGELVVTCVEETYTVDLTTTTDSEEFKRLIADAKTVGAEGGPAFLLILADKEAKAGDVALVLEALRETKALDYMQFSGAF